MDSREAPCQVYIIPVRLDGWVGPKIQHVLHFRKGICLSGVSPSLPGKVRTPASEETGDNNPLSCANAVPGSSDPGILCRSKSNAVHLTIWIGEVKQDVIVGGRFLARGTF